MIASTPLLQVQDVSKRFPGVQALDRVSLMLRAGEVLAVVGENGAGKSTLMKILGGIYRPDAGDIRLDGQPVTIASVNDAMRLGIGLIHQELNLAENLSAAANIFLGREYLRGGITGLLQNRRMETEARALMAQVGLGLSPRTIVGSLSPGHRQLVEIARALSLQVRVLIMDEPTSSLTQRETELLFAVMRRLKERGVGIIYISHRLGEVREVSDRVTVLRDGRNAGELTRDGRGDSGLSHQSLVRLMVGRELNQFFQRRHAPDPSRVRFDLRHFCYGGIQGTRSGLSAPISLQVYAGEILGVAGLIGAGRTEMAEAVCGLRPVLSGEILLDGQPVVFRRPRRAVNAGVLLVPEDRRHNGLILQQSIRTNLSLPNLDRLSRWGFVARHREMKLANDTCARLRVRTPNIQQTVGLLSGGNQQKVVLGKWLARRPRVLIVDEPTRGVDVGAKSEIYGLLDGLAGEGVAILMISSDLEEILGMSDRVAVLHEGRLAGVLPRAVASEEAIMNLATGGELS